MAELGGLFKAIWGIAQTSITLPFIGTTTPLIMMVFLSVLSIAVWFLTGGETE